MSVGGVGCLYLESKSVPAVGVGCLSGNGYYALPLFARYPTCGNICTLWRVRAICGCLDDYTVFSQNEVVLDKIWVKHWKYKS